ncbi:hypothetical protein DIPPA_13576 [Diplonema papillatum]|nr:hypothetical protein DIPPA_13576 [Diplonema papillatum]
MWIHKIRTRVQVVEGAITSREDVFKKTEELLRKEMQTAQDAARTLQEQLDAGSKEKTAPAERDLADVNLALEGQKREAAELQAKARLRDAEAQASTELHKEELAEARRRRDRDLETEQQKHAAEL